MSAILSFEEMKLWRASTEKLTLEEFARKLGKSVEAKKETHDLYDIVKNKKDEPVEIKPKEIRSKETIKPKEAIKIDHKKPVLVQEIKQEIKHELKQDVKEEIKQPEIKVEISVEPEIQPEVKAEEAKFPETKATTTELTFKKKLSEREETVLNYLIQNKDRIVLIKELADLLSLPRDYVYKYIKNLRNKIEQDVLVNADNGGYILNM